MATGDLTDIQSRLFALTPPSWWKGTAPELMAYLGGIAENQAYIYALIAYSKQQTRLQSTTDGFADILAYDYFNVNFPRRTGETDSSYVARILKEILRPRSTRAAIIQAVKDLTGYAPIIQELFNTGDTAAYRYSYYGYATYGSLLYRNQIFVTAYRPSGGGIATVSGYGYGFYGAPTTAYISMSQVQSPVSDAQIYATIAQTIAAGIVAWVNIQNHS